MSCLPLSKVKRIVKFDPDVQLCSHEAVLTTAVAAETFVKLLARELHVRAQSAKRVTLQMKDFDDAVRTVGWLEFLDGTLDGWQDEMVSAEDTVVEANDDEEQEDDDQLELDATQQPAADADADADDVSGRPDVGSITGVDTTSTDDVARTTLTDSFVQRVLQDTVLPQGDGDQSADDGDDDD